MMKAINWRVYERDHIYPQSLAAYLDLLRIAPSPKYPYIAKYYEVISYIGDYFWWARDIDKLEIAFRRWINDWQQYPIKYRQFLKAFSDSHQRVRRVLPGLKNKTKDLDNLSNRQLFGFYYQAKQVLLEDLFLSEYSVDLFDDFFNKIFTEKLSQVSRKEINLTDIQELLRPASPSESLLYRRRLLELSIKKRITSKLVDLIADRFNWIMMSWDGSNEITNKHIKREISSLRKKSIIKRQKELDEIKKFTHSIKDQRSIIIKKYKLSFKSLIFYFNLLDTFTVLHDWRKEAQMRSCQVIFRVLKEISKRFKISYYDLRWYFNSEIENLCLDGERVDQADIRKRQTGLTWVIRQGKISQYLGMKAKKVLNKLVLSVLRVKQVSEIRGIPASRGHVIGNVYNVRSAKEAVRVIKQGGILVTSMTTVDYLPAMRKAAAIVTDDGGLTCHAAIVARELKTPCVVGTKIATQVLKKGNRVEVDATKGIVKKLG